MTTPNQATNDMLSTFIIPSLLLLLGVRAGNERQAFNQVIKVNFVLTNSTTDYPDFSWKDATPSTGLEDPSGLFASYPNTTNDIVGVESFMYVNETRFIVWTPKRVEGELQRLVSRLTPFLAVTYLAVQHHAQRRP